MKIHLLSTPKYFVKYTLALRQPGVYEPVEEIIFSKLLPHNLPSNFRKMHFRQVLL